MSTMDSAGKGDRYAAVYDSPQFTTLRRRSNTFLAWSSATFYGWWLLVILLAAFVPSLFRVKLGGPVNIGLVAVFVSLHLVVAISVVYLRFARTRLDPLSEQIRAELEGDLR